MRSPSPFTGGALSIGGDDDRFLVCKCLKEKEKRKYVVGSIVYHREKEVWCDFMPIWECCGSFRGKPTCHLLPLDGGGGGDGNLVCCVVQENTDDYDDDPRRFDDDDDPRRFDDDDFKMSRNHYSISVAIIDTKLNKLAAEPFLFSDIRKPLAASFLLFPTLSTSHQLEPLFNHEIEEEEEDSSKENQNQNQNQKKNKKKWKKRKRKRKRQKQRNIARKMPLRSLG